MTDTHSDHLDPLEQLRRLQAVTDVALSHLAVEDLLDELLARVRDVLEADTAAVLLLDEATDELVARAAKGIEEEVEQGVRIPIGRGFAGTIAAQRHPVILDEVDHSNVMNPILRQKGIRSLLGVPLLLHGRLLGVLHVGTLTPRRFTASDVELLQLVADRVALAINVGLYERQRMVTETLQRTFLPERLPAVLGADLVARYIPASRTGVGGDWYDAFTLPSGQTIVAVGDVVGRGLQAASVMGRLRNALRAYAIHGLSPTEIVSALNTMLQFFDRDEMATLLYCVVDVRERTLTLVNAGHLPPLLTEPDAGARFLETPPHPPLGARPSLRPAAHTFALAPGSVLLLYTDGLVEQRRGALTERMEVLRATLDRSGDHLEDLPETILHGLVDVDTTDDVAFLAVRLVRTMSGPERITIPARPAELARLRSMLRTWLGSHGVAEPLSYDILVATGEACANAIEHAYGAEDGTVEITLTRSDTSLSVSVRDAGHWRRPRGTGRGRGLMMMRKLASSLDVATGEDGTTVTLGWRLPRQDVAS